ncbi:MAG: 4-carboxy-2-hydroxymuconate-6-semialdehyde dehydrogenase [Actinobacteria bacterium ADurb.BinA094]|nr:MAG: 4-carboxy-2-hydroxymuconate-6-semialdehyde dehydrogenase [Actinobacteria bacterium ADurb.BinA094]
MTNVAIVGYGYWGPNLLRNYLEVPGVSVAWVCDRRPEALEKVRRRYPAQAVSGSYDEVLADSAVDAVVIATPISTHFDLAAAALRAGKHVFVEKPMTSSTTDAEELVRLAGETGLTLMVGHTFVFSPPVRKLGELIHDGSLGDIHFITSSRVNLGLHQKDVSVVWDLATHDLSILYYWLGESASSVYVTGRGCIVPEIPDVAFVNLRFPSGVVANVDIAWLSPVKLRRTVVVGSRRMALYDDTESVEKVKIFDHGVDYKEPESFGEFHLSYRTGDIVAPRLDTVEPLFAEASHFIECVTTGGRPITDGRAGLQVVASLEAAERSLRDHGGVQTIAAAHGPGD